MDDQRVRSGGGRLDTLALFSVMWALAAVWHLLGNPSAGPAWAQSLLGLGVALVLLRPGASLPLAALAAAGLVSVWEEAPVLGNHWLLAGCVNLGILMSVAAAALRGRAADRTDLANRLFPVARLCLLGFYAFAAFSKLNSAFFDRRVSCAAFYFREATDSVGLTGLQLGGTAWVERAVIVATVVIEVSIPLLLLFTRTRRLGVLVGLVFHALLAVDHTHQFFDFSSVLFALFVLFLPATAGPWVTERVGSVRARLALRHERLPQRVHLLLVAIPTTVALLVAVDAFTVSEALNVGWWAWQIFAVTGVVAALRYLGHDRTPARVRLAPHHVLFVLVPLLVLANGLTPYLELKTGQAWNMYANLRTVDGESNHLIVRRTFPLTDEQADVVEVLDTDSAALARYAATDFGLTWRQFRTYLAQHPDVRVTYRRAGTTVALSRASDDAELVAPVPEWREKVQLFRAVDLTEPERCVPTFGAARRHQMSGGVGSLVQVSAFRMVSDFAPAGDQPNAVAALTEGIERGDRYQTLLGITGSGKSATIAWTIEQVQRPTLVLAPNKSLAAQLANEFREFFPDNRVEYFVSYYDYYQPEAYIASSDTYIEKDSSVNDEIDRLRHAATSALLTRRDVIVVASVSCIYGLGSPEEYRENLLQVRVGDEIDQRKMLRKLVDMQYERNDMNLVRGKFRVRGDTIEVHPAYDEMAVRIELFGDEVERIQQVDTLTGEQVAVLDELVLYPATHYVAGEERMQKAIVRIEQELQEQLARFEKEGKLLEAQRLRMRTQYDLEMMQEVGYCNGIENYSAPIDGRGPGEAPNTLLDFFPDDFLMVIDESHVAVPQLHGQYEGDRSRKLELINHGFRLPSAADNRPLRFEEVIERINQAVFVSATPGPFELQVSSQVASQIVRPTGLVDPEVIVKPTKGQIDDLIEQINQRMNDDGRVLVTTLTKKMAEDLSDYLLEQGLRVRYLHSNVDTIQRIEILRDLRLGEYDVLVGINLLREGLDLPEVSLVAILDADKEGFLRSDTSLIQTMGRAARNVDGQVIMYADTVTDSMRRAISETQRRRRLQLQHNEEHGIEPETIRKAVTDILAMLRPAETAPVPGKDQRGRSRDQLNRELGNLAGDELRRLILTLEEEMHEASTELRFEYAARLRDEIKDLKRELRDVG